MGIQANKLNKFYGETQVLHDVSFHCGKGETLVLLGPSGAGKSSLLRLLNLLETADSGALSIANNSYDFSKQVTENKV
ncbi:Arginine transport ATP-binding protein ArtP [Vibrio thalassae]|uniref:Arginine transport ATP-binding protein ArtP n=1 Tax=Vibrio thalassae TaxID=1243014 RepID=A0A240EHS2_9VIBR|nr:Arginine transport ATP-binding protein ArtP [Vibrio thalassae]